MMSVSDRSVRARGGVRLAVLDDEAFVRTPEGTHHPVAATFHHFVEAVVREGQFARASYMIPVRRLRPGDPRPALPAIDEQLLDVVATAPFRGIADYVLRAGPLSLVSWPRIHRAVAASDLVWLRLPASNGLLALTACRLARVPHFAWVAGSVGDVVVGQDRALPNAAAARSVAAAYDAVTDLACRLGPSIRLDGDIFTSVVTDADLAATDDAWPGGHRGPSRIAWAGRMAAEKGLPELLAAVGQLAADGLDVELSLIGDGPMRGRIEEYVAGNEPLRSRVSFHGYVADRTTYFALLRAADIFVNPSRAEGVPKVLVEAMAAGLPIVATSVGGVPHVLDRGRRGRLVPAANVDALASELRRLLVDAALRRDLRARGLAYARERTAEAQARRLVEWLRGRFPSVAWTA